MTVSLKDLTALGIPENQSRTLMEHGFDLATFQRLQQMLSSGEFPMAKNQLTEPISPPLSSDLTPWPENTTPLTKAQEEVGRQAVKEGQVAAVVLNGGMATRFGGVVKGVVNVLGNKSFLGLRCLDVAEASKKAPMFLLNSFATLADTHAHLSENAYFGLTPNRVHLLCQNISLRLTENGQLFRTEEGQVSLYAPGHGDLFSALAHSDRFLEFKAKGGKYLLVSNVDNVGATLSPQVIGAHIAGKRPVTVEVAAREPGDQGGAPARVRHRVAIIEGFRFPKNFDIASIPVFNTNTMVLDVDAVKADYPLTWFRADKKVDDRPVVQFERLMGEVTSFVDAHYLVVPRDGNASRFLPVKTPEDLNHLRPQIAQRLSALGPF